MIQLRADLESQLPAAGMQSLLTRGRVLSDLAPVPGAVEASYSRKGKVKYGSGAKQAFYT